MTTGEESTETPDAPSAAPPRQRLRGILIIGVPLFLFVLAGLLAAAPWLLSTSPGRKLAVHIVNARLDGELAVDSWRLTWSDGVSVDGLTLSLPGQGVTADVARVSISAGILALLGDAPDLGTVRVEQPDIRLALAAAPAAAPAAPPTPPPAASHAEQLVVAPPTGTPPTARGNGAHTATAGAAPLPALKGTLIVADGTLRVSGGPVAVASLDRIACRATLDLPREPIAFEFTAAQPDGGTLTAQGRLAPAGPDGVIDPHRMTGEIAAAVHALELAPGSALATALDPGLPTASGRLSSELTLSIGGAREGHLSGTVSLADLRLAGGPLGADAPAFDTIELTADVACSADRLILNALRLDTPCGGLTATGHVATTVGNRYPDAVFSTRGSLDIAALSRLLPHTLGLKPAVTLTNGTAVLDAHLHADRQSLVFDGNIRTTPIAAWDAGRRVAVATPPMRMAARGCVDSEGPRVEALVLDAPFAQVEGNGSMTNLTVNIRLDIAAALAEARKFVGGNTLDAAGELNAALRLRRVDDRESALTVVVGLNNLRLTGATPRPIERPRSRAAVNGRLELNSDGLPAALREVSAVIESDPLGVTASLDSLQFPGGTRGTSLAGLRVVVTGDVARLVASAADAGLLGTNRPPHSEGAAELSATVAMSNGVTSVEQAELKLTGLVFDAGGTSLVEPEIALRTRLTLAPDHLMLEQLKLSSRPLSFDVAGELEQPATRARLKLAGELTCDMDRIAQLVTAFTDTDIRAAGTRPGPVSFQGELGGGRPVADILRTATGAARVHVDRLVYMGLEIGACDPSVELADGRLHAVVEAAAGGGRLTVVPLVDFRVTPPVLQFPDASDVARNVGVTRELTSGLLCHVHPVLKDCGVLGGAMSATLDSCHVPLDPAAMASTARFSGRLGLTNMSLRASGLLGQVLQLAGVSRTEVDVPYQEIRFACEEGRITSSPLVIKAGAVKLVFQGSVGLDGRLAYEAVMPVPEERVSEHYRKYVEGVTVRIPIGGTLNHPEVSEQALRQTLQPILEQAARTYMKDEGAKRLQEKGAKLLEKLFDKP